MMQSKKAMSENPITTDRTFSTDVQDEPEMPPNKGFDRSRRSELLNLLSMPLGGPVNRGVRRSSWRCCINRVKNIPHL